MATFKQLTPKQQARAEAKAEALIFSGYNPEIGKWDALPRFIEELTHQQPQFLPLIISTKARFKKYLNKGWINQKFDFETVIMETLMATYNDIDAYNDILNITDELEQKTKMAAYTGRILSRLHPLFETIKRPIYRIKKDGNIAAIPVDKIEAENQELPNPQEMAIKYLNATNTKKTIAGLKNKLGLESYYILVDAIQNKKIVRNSEAAKLMIKAKRFLNK